MLKGFADSPLLGFKTIFKSMLGFESKVDVLPRRMDEKNCLVCVVHTFGVGILLEGKQIKYRAQIFLKMVGENDLRGRCYLHTPSRPVALALQSLSQYYFPIHNVHPPNESSSASP